MREVNFSVPSANRASTGITTALYDRRALDCTSTLPLINSLNHLAYLTLSSPRIRQILTLDGGVERLVAMLKKGKSNNMLDNWKWHLALQCVVNIGVRGSDARASDAQGSESIRTRVVEADIVPVIATVLDNYMQAVESRNRHRTNQSEMRLEEHLRRRSMQRAEELDSNTRNERRRPPPIQVVPNEPNEPNVPAPPVLSAVEDPQAEASNAANAQPSLLSSPLETSPTHNLYAPHHRQNRSETLSSPATEQPNSPVDALSRPPNPFGPYLYPPMRFRNDPSSQPDTPTTPTALSRSNTRRRSASAGPIPSPRTLRQASSMSGDSDEGETSVEPSAPRQAAPSNEQHAQANELMDVEMEVQPNVLEAVEPEEDDDFAGPEVTGDVDSETFNIRHRSIDGSLVEADAQQINTVFAPDGGLVDLNGPPDNSRVMLTPVPPVLQDNALNGPPPAAYRRVPQDDVSSSGILAWTPHDEDVIMSLQLLAYVSKYCVLRSYFQQSHLVPSLKTKHQSNTDGNDESIIDTSEEDHDNEYCQPDDYNIFPLVEKFTVRHYSNDMKYWACVVMRNLCRKDKTRGDIRQCAYYKCGKWEEYARQFAKCRRCRQTKYCSKECQKNAWVFHRHWCEPARESYQRHSHSHNHGQDCRAAHTES